MSKYYNVRRLYNNADTTYLQGVVYWAENEFDALRKYALDHSLSLQEILLNGKYITVSEN